MCEDSPSFDWLPRLLQVSDSAFPTGGYAHSCGFEQIVRFGLVRDEATLNQFLQQHLWPMLTHFELPIIRYAQEAAQQQNLPELLDLDASVEATKTAREIREASRAMGRRRLHAFNETSPSALLRSFTQEISAGRTPGHHPIIYAIGLAKHPREALLSAWAYQSLSSVCLAAPKLIRIGQDGIQRVLTSCLPRFSENLRQALTVSYEEIGWFDPTLELASFHHEIAYERLYIS